MINAKPVKRKAPDPSEDDIEQWLREEIEKRGGLFFKFKPAGKVGVPDRIAIWKRKNYPEPRIDFIELKKAGETPEDHQERMHRILRTYNCNVEVIIGKKEAIEYLKAIDSL